MDSEVSLEDLMSFMKIWNGRCGDGVRGTFDFASLVRGASVIDDSKWRLAKSGPMEGKARYQTTPHGVLVQGPDQKMSLMSEMVATSIGLT